MEELIKIQVKNDRQLVDARELHKGLGLKRQFTDWVKQNFKGFEENVDFMFSPQSVNMPNGGVKHIQDYLITIDMAKELCMMSKTPKGKEVRKYFIQVEKDWNSPEMVMHRALEFSNARIKQLTAKNQSLTNQNKDLQDKIDRDADDVLFSHAIRYSNHSIKIRELAAILTQNGFQIGQNQLYQLLRLEHYISKHGTLPMGDKIKRGYFRVTHGVNNGHAWSTTLVTPEGQKHIINKALRGKFDDSYQKVIVSTLGI
jgi:anti-repressor protein